ncbi:MAG: penicillin-insensitive murein endopeptidase [Solirubrobacteraceae bacterium]|nr:penicillin-insensitive murein endopeptidase [Solirubrobacteraceae bacterium]
MTLLRGALAALAILATGLAGIMFVTSGRADSGPEPQLPAIAYTTTTPAPSPVPSAARKRSSPTAKPSAALAAERRRAKLRRLESMIRWRTSTAHGTPNAGSLSGGVRLPREGVHFFTWDPVLWKRLNRSARLHTTDRLARLILRVAREHAREHPGAPRIAVGDLSRKGGGSFDASHGVLGEFGGPGTLGHVSHQNGLDADIYYPRRDRLERAPGSLRQIDRKLAQDLVDRFVAAGAQFVFVGPGTGLTGPAGIVQPTPRHDDHLHVRLAPSAR